MSNTPAEIRDHIGFIYQAKGNVLIAGLGLGMMKEFDKFHKATVEEIIEQFKNK